MSNLDEDIIALLIPITAVAGGVLIALLCIILGAVKSISRNKQREESRREIAAYVAEGSMTPQDAERILATGVDADAGDDA